MLLLDGWTIEWLDGWALVACVSGNGAFVFGSTDVTEVSAGVAGSVWRCHNHAANAARTRTLATGINSRFGLFLSDDMVRIFLRLIDNKLRKFCKVHSAGSADADGGAVVKFIAFFADRCRLPRVGFP